MESKGAELIAKERQRQIEEEGWTAKHDDRYSNHELAHAAVCYILSSISMVETWWPWSFQWWKPKDRKQDLIRAGALIAAEIDRVLREEKKEK